MNSIVLDTVPVWTLFSVLAYFCTFCSMGLISGWGCCSVLRQTRPLAIL